MDLTETRFRFAIIDPKSKKIIHHESYPLDTSDRDGVGAVLENEIFKHTFATYSLSAGTLRNTLIPSELFSHTTAKEAFALNFTPPIDNLDYNRIPELGLVNVYEIPLWIKSLFVIRFPRVKFIHPSTVFLKGIFDLPTFSPKVHLYFLEGQFYIVITNRSKLTLFNQFHFEEISDVVYYTLYALEQSGMTQDDLKVCLYGVDRSWEKLEAFKTFFKARIDVDLSPRPAENYLLLKHTTCA